MHNHSDSKFDLHFEKLKCIVLHSWVLQSVIDVAKRVDARFGS